MGARAAMRNSGWVAPLLACAMALTPLASTSAFASDPMLARQLTDRGIAQQQEGDHAAALLLFDAALLETDHPKIRYFRAKSLKSLERLDAAVAEFEAILDRPEVAKYRSEILSFINEMKGAQERERLAKKLEDERRAREKAEAERRQAERRSDDAAIGLLRQKRSGLLPATELRMQDGPTLARITPLVPSTWEPTTDYEGRLEVMKVMRGIERYETELTAAKVLSVLAVVGVSVGVGLGMNPLADEGPSAGVQQAGLAVGVVGVVSGLAAMVLWPSEPVDPRAARAGAAAEGAAR
jgi:hypothetical protein